MNGADQWGETPQAEWFGSLVRWEPGGVGAVALRKGVGSTAGSAW